MTDELTTNHDEETDLMAPAIDSMAFLTEVPNLDEAEVGINIAPKYFEFKDEGDQVRAIYNGMTTITSTKNGDRKDIPAVVFQNKEGVFLNSGASLINQLRNLQPGRAIQITYTGKEKTKGGNNVNTFDVRLLNVAPVNMPSTTKQILPPKPKVNNDVVTAFWTKITAMKMTNIEGQNILNEFGGNFSQALASLEAPF